MCFAEQECHLRENQVDDRRLDQDPGFEVRDKNTAGCDMTLDECKAARLALDWKAEAVEEINNASFPTGCYRQQNASYRFSHSLSSYEWYFNSAEGQSNSESEPICKGDAKLSCWWAYYDLYK